MKVHLFYYHKSLYAYTTCKKIAGKFRIERSMSLIVEKTTKMSDIDYAKFANKNNKYSLIENVFEYQNGEVSNLTTTYEEDDLVTRHIEDIQERAYNSTRYIRDIPLKEEYLEILCEGYRYISKPSNPTDLNIDTLSIFIDLFSPTFTGIDTDLGG